MVAEVCNIMDFNLGDGTANVFLKLAPELPDLGLGLRVGRPVVSDVLILTGQLAVEAAVAF
jgi:hypothetical protein